MQAKPKKMLKQVRNVLKHANNVSILLKHNVLKHTSVETC